MLDVPETEKTEKNKLLKGKELVCTGKFERCEILGGMWGTK